MFYGTKHVKNRLSDRLTGIYTLLFTVILFILSIGVFFAAFQFLLQKQLTNLAITTELMSDHLIEEIEENESFAHSGILEEQNNDPYLSVFLYDASGNMINRMLNFPLDENSLPDAASSPVMVYNSGHLMLCSSQQILYHGASRGTLYIVQKLQSETAFLKLLGILLIGANLIGALAALWVGNYTSRKMLSPISQMIDATKQIGGSNLDMRLDIPEPDDELKSLALTINSMLERVSSAYQQQGRFVADVSHELRTPLAVMQGNVDLLSRWGSEDKTVLKDSIQALQKQTAYMNQLVENLLFLARFDNMQSQLQISKFAASELFAELLEEQALIDSGHHYEISVPAADDTISADKTMIKQMLRALIDNSVKYTPKGGTIQLGFAADETAFILSVSDDGIGMDAEHCYHIFDRFYRVDAARTRATGGMGLGLSIVSAIAQAHGGYAYVDSEPEIGTTISVVFQKQDIA
ncbi:Adaptive-response sensory-kinase SasA [bioreactor metagenome]|uniref:histidine kinase n=1 Tax=bioreactor metagenome TaxID=1076179 RepID=A0A644Z328_9ZZZZ|nr:ATP-binding protein [Christensenella sp.]